MDIGERVCESRQSSSNGRHPPQRICKQESSLHRTAFALRAYPTNITSSYNPVSGHGLPILEIHVTPLDSSPLCISSVLSQPFRYPLRKLRLSISRFVGGKLIHGRQVECEGVESVVVVDELF